MRWRPFIRLRTLPYAFLLIGSVLVSGCAPALAGLPVPAAPAAHTPESYTQPMVESSTDMPPPMATATIVLTPTSMPTVACCSQMTPTPTPTELPPHMAAAAVPNPVLQGHMLLVRVTTSHPMTVTSTLGDRTLVLDEASPGHYWAPIGISARADPGEVALTVRAFDHAGRELRRELDLEIADAGYATEDITLSPETAALLDPELVRAERERLVALWEQSSPRQQWHAVWQPPSGSGQAQGSIPSSTSAFGTRRSYNGGPITSFHAGQDFQAEAGEPVYAPTAGTVVLAEPLQVRGNTVWLDHGLGIYSGYFHLSDIEVAVGQKVKPGDLIGRVGSTGLSTGPHLHWEIRVDGVAVDPLEWVERYVGHPDDDRRNRHPDDSLAGGGPRE